MIDEEEILGEEVFKVMEPSDRYDILRDKGQGYNVSIVEHHKNLAEICK